MSADLSVEYQSLTTGAGLFAFRGRTLIELSGADAASFLQGFCTNEVKRLNPGQGCEAFITSVQGKVLGHVIISREADRIVLETVAGEAQRLIPHLDRYIIRKQVVLTDRSQEWSEILLGGAASPALLIDHFQVTPPQSNWGSASASLGGHSIVVQRADPILAGPGFLLRAAAEDWAAVEQALLAAGAVRCSEATFDTVRIEAGWPLYGRDITDQNLPQEVDRDSQAISFTKGCYLGQETVARIDALGHVNRKLRSLKFSQKTAPMAGLPLLDGEKPVGEITSATLSPKFSAPLALGYVRRGHNEPGTRLTGAQGEAIVMGQAID